MKTLDMADKYDPLSYEDDEPTVRVQVPNIPILATVGEEEDDFDLHGDRDTLPCPPPYPQPHMRQEVNWGAWASLLFLALFWGTIAYFIFR